MRRAAGLIVVLGVLAAGLWSVGAAPLGCCGADCTQCPTTFCKAASHFTALVTPPVLDRVFRVDPKPRRDPAAPAFHPPIRLAGFDGPLRN